MLVDESLTRFAAAAAAQQPTPGGGSISAYIGVLGTAMGAMAARYSEGRKDLVEHADALTAEIGRLDELRAELGALVDADAAAYAGLNEAFKLPKGDDVEKAARRAAIQAGLAAALDPPLRMCRAAVAGLEVLDALRKHCNPNLASDVAVGAYALAAAFRGASVNVLVNLKSIKDDDLRARVSDEGGALAERALRLEGDISAAVIESLQA